MLLRQEGTKGKITREAVKAAAENKLCGTGILGLDKCREGLDATAGDD
jgi:hypothetical protein